ncbi:unnamed protein product [Hydatigera taeniaeformis]|uniref:Transposase n=1 Tax=Hydatigena taeniaeformis TaxID=6205 RepID=A0A0R3WNG7_HYDTA|nr:unnamed protein product [Hydatigera taeniaeformis]
MSQSIIDTAIYYTLGCALDCTALRQWVHQRRVSLVEPVKGICSTLLCPTRPNRPGGWSVKVGFLTINCLAIDGGDGGVGRQNVTPGSGAETV